jgi:hypothetical protein
MKLDDLLPASRNFTITLAERVRAQEGLPAHLYRLGRIEQILEKMLSELRALDEDARRSYTFALDLSRLNRLIESHNRYYPIEANLPIDPDSGGVRDFRPIEPITPEILLGLVNPTNR